MYIFSYNAKKVRSFVGKLSYIILFSKIIHAIRFGHILRRGGIQFGQSPPRDGIQFENFNLFLFFQQAHFGCTDLIFIKFISQLIEGILPNVPI